MTIFQAAFLGVVQGMTEFLPISSSAHLVFAQYLMGFHKPLLFFDVMLHQGTLLALFVYFAADLAHIIRDSIYGIFFLIRRKPLKQIAEMAPHSKWALGIIVAMIPTGLMGIFFKHWFESLFGSFRDLGIQMLITTALLVLTRFFPRGAASGGDRQNGKGIEQATYLDFLIIGVMQGIAIIPAISRSGATIAAALFLGIKRDDAFRFSFLISIPAILGAGLLEMKDGFAGIGMSWPALAAGFTTSAIFGFLSLFWLARVTRRGKLYLFGVYTFLFSLLVFYLSPRLP